MTFSPGTVLAAAQLNSILSSIALLAPIAGPQFTGSVQVGPNLFVTLMSAGDVWITANASFDGTNWNRINIADYCYAIVYQWASTIPGEFSNTGMMFLRATPAANPLAAFWDVGGWENGFILDQYRHLVVGGYGIEIDGSGTVPYGRLTHYSNGSPPVYTGILKNLYVDLSGVDVGADPSWFMGFLNDAMTIQRAPANSTTLAALWGVGNTGMVTEGNSTVVGALTPGTALTAMVNIVTSVSVGAFLQLATPAAGLEQVVVNTTSSSLTITTPAGTIANASTVTIAGYGVRRFYGSDATHWF